MKKEKKKLTLEDLKKWVNGASFREVRITPHAHGLRVTLHEHWHGLSTSVSEDLLEAFTEAIEYYPQWKLREFEKRMKELEKEIEDGKQRLRFLEGEHSVASKLFSEAEKADSEKMLDILSKKSW